MITTQFTKTVNTQRLTTVTGSLKETWQTNLSNIPCAIHPISGEQQEFLEGAFYKTFKMWFASSADIQIGDRVIEGSSTYLVKGVAGYDFGKGGNNYKFATISLI